MNITGMRVFMSSICLFRYFWNSHQLRHTSSNRCFHSLWYACQIFLRPCMLLCGPWNNVLFSSTYQKQAAGESPNDYYDRCIRTATSWYMRHLGTSDEFEIVLITNDAGNRNRAVSEGIKSMTIQDYVKTYLADYSSTLSDLVANPTEIRMFVSLLG